MGDQHSNGSKHLRWEVQFSFFSGLVRYLLHGVCVPHYGAFLFHYEPGLCEWPEHQEIIQVTNSLSWCFKVKVSSVLCAYNIHLFWFVNGPNVNCY